MQTRRQLLEQALILPLVPSLKANLEIVTEPNCLSRESAVGFRSLAASGLSKVILLCGVSAADASLALRLRDQAAAGSWVIWESSPFACGSQARIMRDIFGLDVGAPVAASTGLYVGYRWPCVAMVRSFSAVIPVTCSDQETIVLYGDIPVAMKRAIGRGGLVFLGSMLGPNLRAEDHQARAIAMELLHDPGKRHFVS